LCVCPCDLAVKATPSDEDGASTASYASSVAEHDDPKGAATLSSLSHVCIGEKHPAGASAPYVPITPAERARLEAQREQAIEKSWEAEESRLHNGELVEVLREDLRVAQDKLQHSLAECKYLREKADRLAQENRILRRSQRAGKRDEVILQLETELQAKEDERAEMEEKLAGAFSEVVKDLSNRVTALTAERDRLLVSLESTTHRRKA